MLTTIIPKLPMRDKAATKDYYVNKLGFRMLGDSDFDGYLLLQKDNVEIHFLSLMNSIRMKTMGKFISAQATLILFTKAF